MAAAEGAGSALLECGAAIIPARIIDSVHKTAEFVLGFITSPPVRNFDCSFAAPTPHLAIVKGTSASHAGPYVPMSSVVWEFGPMSVELNSVEIKGCASVCYRKDNPW